MNVLVVNAGSSTLRFEVIATDGTEAGEAGEERLAKGLVERIGGLAILTLWSRGGARHVVEEPLRDHRAAIEHLLRWLVSPDSEADGIATLADIHAVGHRVVHGGQRFRSSVRIDESVIAGIEDHVELAPLHNPSNVKGIVAIRECLGPQVPQVAVFDTAFHASMPEEAFLYAIPYHYYRRFQVRRYGFHGTSHRYVTGRYHALTGRRAEDTRIITLHLGNGCSACAVRGGVSIDTSMGFTPLEGLVMGTRSGDVDPAILDFIGHKEGLAPGGVETMLNRQSGLLGVSGMTGDMRELLAEEAESGDRRVRLAIDIFCRRVRKYIGAYHAELGGADAVVFAGGIGENAPAVRERICRGLECLGLHLDAGRNAALVGQAGRIATESSRLDAWVIPTDEELLIARDTARLVAGAAPRPTAATSGRRSG